MPNKLKEWFSNLTPPTEKELEPDVEMEDKELIQLSDSWMKDADSFHNKLKKIQDKNEKYWLGEQTQKSRIPSHKCDAVENLVFMATETIVPIVTANTPQFVVDPAQETEGSIELAKSVQEMLKKQYEMRRVKYAVGDAVRHMILYTFGCLYPYWNEYIDDWDVKVIRPQRLWIPKWGDTIQDVPVIMKVDFTITEIREYFGDDKAEDVKERISETESGYEKAVTAWECWSADNKFVFWRYKDLILKKQKNLYFDFKGRKDKTKDEFGNEVVLDVYHNHFRRPKKPFIILSPFKLGYSPISDTSLVEQGIPLSDVNNTLLRQIVNNAKKMGNSAWLIDSDTMEEEKAKNITNEEGLIIYGSGVANQNKLRREAPPPMPNYIPNAKMMSSAVFDNIMGTHATTRGERRDPETLGGRILLKQGDISRNSTLVKELDRSIAELGNWAVQMMKMFYYKQRTAKIYGTDGIKFIRLSRDKIEDGIEVVIKAGSTIQTDEVSRRNEAIQLWQQGALSPIDLFERLKFPNPRETAERLWKWQTGNLFPGQQQAMEQAMKIQERAKGVEGKGAGGVETRSPLREIQQARKRPGGGGGV